MPRIRLTLCAMIYALVVSGCQSLLPVALPKVEPAKIPALPAELAQKREPNFCRRLLTLLSVSPPTAMQRCDNSTEQ